MAQVVPMRRDGMCRRTTTDLDRETQDSLVFPTFNIVFSCFSYKLNILLKSRGFTKIKTLKGSLLPLCPPPSMVIYGVDHILSSQKEMSRVLINENKCKIFLSVATLVSTVQYLKLSFCVEFLFFNLKLAINITTFCNERRVLFQTRRTQVWV